MRLTDSRILAIKPPETGQDEHKDDLVQGLRLRVGAGGRKSWIVRARHGGKQLNRTLGPYPLIGLADARDQAKAFLLGLLTDTEPPVVRTFGEVATAWMEKHAKLRNRTADDQQRQLDSYVLPKWKARDIRTITRGEVRTLIEAIDDGGAPIVANRILALIKPIFGFALDRDWIDFSPAHGIKRLNAENSRDRFLDEDDVALFWRSTELLAHPFRPFMQLLLLTGQRKGEVAGMTWDAIDLDAGRWTLTAADTKAKRSHVVPLSTKAVAILDALPRFGPYVFTTNGETQIGAFSQAKVQLDRFMTVYGGEAVPDWRLHDLRRTVATHLQRLGFSEELVGKILNHAPKGVTGRHYALFAFEAEKRGALEAWAGEVGRLANGND